MPEQQSIRLATWVLAIVPLLMAMGYIGLSLVAFYKQDWLPGASILHMALLGPPALLVWGGNMLGLYGVCTAAIVLLLTAGAALRSDELKIIVAVTAVFVWLGAGFFSASLSV